MSLEAPNDKSQPTKIVLSSKLKDTTSPETDSRNPILMGSEMTNWLENEKSSSPKMSKLDSIADEKTNDSTPINSFITQASQTAENVLSISPEKQKSDESRLVGCLKQDPYGLLNSDSFLVKELVTSEIGYRQEQSVRIMHWNLNSLNKRLESQATIDYIKKGDFDIVCFTETKYQLKNFIDRKLDEHELWATKYNQYWCFSTKKKGYSGVGILSKQMAISVQFGLGSEYYDTEGRAIVVEFATFFVICVYVPCTKNDQTMLRMTEFDSKLREVAADLKKKKDVFILGDFNVITSNFDCYDPIKAKKYPCVTVPEHQQSMSKLYSLGFKDTFRVMHPETKTFTWWDARFNQRSIDHGLRLDFAIVNEEAMERVKESKMASNVMGSDHCPIELQVLTKGYQVLPVSN